MTRRVVITGLGPISGLGLGLEAHWRAVCAGQSALARLTAFDASGFACQIGAQVPEFKLAQYIPKSYRKAAKVMARDIELAVVAADLAVRDAGLITRGTLSDDTTTPTSYEPSRVGAHIGAGLIAAEIDELTSALVMAKDPATDRFDMKLWGKEGMTHLTPLWLLKYLPNMLACHVTIIHDAQGPSNTITCAEASSGLSIGESLRVIQRGDADAGFCGGTESKLNPMAFLRRSLTGQLTAQGNDDPAHAVRPFCQSASGTALGEGGGILILEALETYQQRKPASHPPYAEIVGYGSSQTLHPQDRNRTPDPQGRGIRFAIEAALREAAITPADIDMIVPFGSGIPVFDQAEAAALHAVFGSELARIPLITSKTMTGNCGAGSGTLDVCIAAQAIATQTLPATLNCEQPLPGLKCRTSPAQSATIRHALTYSTGAGGQNAALVLRKIA